MGSFSMSMQTHGRRGTADYGHGVAYWRRGRSGKVRWCERRSQWRRRSWTRADPRQLASLPPDAPPRHPWAGTGLISKEARCAPTRTYICVLGRDLCQFGKNGIEGRQTVGGRFSSFAKKIKMEISNGKLLEMLW